MKIEETNIIKEIKKEYLLNHLDEVKEIIGQWIRELLSPEPFMFQKARWGWQETYKPETEKNVDKTHILRHHVVSRTLWRCHTDWEKQLANEWEYIRDVRQKAIQLNDEDINKRTESIAKFSYTENYISAAIWTAFKQVKERGIKYILDYKTHSNEASLYYGSYGIETTVDNPEDRKLIEQHHREFISQLQQDEVMIKAVEQVTALKQTEKKMIELAEKHLKATDILHPCRFCRHLWK